MSAEFELNPGVVVAVRYRVEDELPPQGELLSVQASSVGGPIHGAIDQITGEAVSIFRVSAAHASGLVPLVGLQHPHLARVLAVPELPDGSHAVVIERVGGSTVDSVLREVGHETTVEAVRSALRLADAVTVIHQAGGLHGFLHSGSLLPAPTGKKPPLLSFAPFPLSPAPSPFRLPGEPGNAAPSAAGDAWGLGALFYLLLLGHAPPVGGLSSEGQLLEAGVSDASLRAALFHALASEPKDRGLEVTTLKRELARWFVDQSSDDISVVSGRGSVPPPLPTSSIPPGLRPESLTSASTPAAAGPSRKAPPKGRLSRGWVIGLTSGAFILALALGWGLSSLRPDSVRVVEIPSATVGAPSAAPATSVPPPIDLGEIAVTTDAGAMDDTGRCVADFLPKGTFGAQVPAFNWVCSQSDPREGGAQLRAGVVAGRPPDGISDSMKAFSQLGWYEMAAYAVVYRACCPDAAPLKLPSPSAGCDKIDELLERVVGQVLAENPLDEPLQKLAAAIDCEAKANRGPLYRQKGRSEASEQQSFLGLVRKIEAPGK